MTDPTPTPQTPPQGLTDEQLLELMPQQFRDDLATVSRLAAYGTSTEPGLYRVSLNTGALAYARAAIAAHEAALAAASADHVLGVRNMVPADEERKEREELAKWLEFEADNVQEIGSSTIYDHDRLRWAAGYLRQLPPEELSVEEHHPEVESRFRAWWAESFPNAPAGPHAVRSHVAFAMHLLAGEVAA